MEEVTFNRSVKPEDVKGQPSLVCFYDGSMRGIGCNIYIRWKFNRPRVDNIVERQEEYHVQLVVGKAKIAKSSKVPRNEMDSLVMLARLITAILSGMVEKPSSIMIIGDSKCTIQI